MSHELHRRGEGHRVLEACAEQMPQAAAVMKAELSVRCMCGERERVVSVWCVCLGPLEMAKEGQGTEWNVIGIACKLQHVTTGN